MNADRNRIRGLGLCSGGLDSILAALVLKKQGVDAEWITFETPFFSAEKARNASRATGIPLSVENITDTYLHMLKDPNCGYGKNMNPCMDCHALMFKLAGVIMRKRGFHFLFSGEVLGQRPMSQTRPSLKYVEKHSGMGGYILRPLSALKLEETIPEQEGWVGPGAAPGLVRQGQKTTDPTGRGIRRDQIPRPRWRLPAHRQGLLPPPEGPDGPPGETVGKRTDAVEIRSPFSHDLGNEKSSWDALKWTTEAS